MIASEAGYKNEQWSRLEPLQLRGLKIRSYPKGPELKKNMRIIQNLTVAPRPIMPPIKRNLDPLTPRQRNPGKSQINPESHCTPNRAMYDLSSEFPDRDACVGIAMSLN